MVIEYVVFGLVKYVCIINVIMFEFFFRIKIGSVDDVEWMVFRYFIWEFIRLLDLLLVCESVNMIV